MEVDVGNAVARMAVLEDAEHEALPWFHMERAIEEGAALDGLAVDGDRQGIMPRGGLKERADREWGASDASKVTAVPWGQGALSSGTTWAASRPRK